jgi:hypothetical protein
VDSVLKKGLAFLANAQLPTGGFMSYSSPAINQFKPTIAYQTLFMPAAILSCLASIDWPEAAPIRKKLASYLLAQQSVGGSFNYFTQNTPERKKFAYPDDLDDTFLALGALAAHDSNLVSPRQSANAIKLLIQNEITPGGPYRTWLVAGATPLVWRDTDVAVNCNIAAYLQTVSRPPRKLILYLEEQINNEEFSSPYYIGAAPVLYFLARGYRGPSRGKLQTIIQQHLITATSSLEVALLLCAADKAPPCALSKIIAAQQKDGSWLAEAFSCDPSISGQKYVAGAAALSTALALQAIVKHGVTKTLPEKGPIKLSHDRLHQKIVQVTQQHVPDSLQDVLKRILSSNKNGEITLLPLMTAQALNTSIPPDSLIDLGVASLCGWLAYTVFDSFLDDQGRALQLPGAIGLLRQALTLYQSHLPAQFIETIFAKMDQANCWELSNCRRLTALPEYGDRLVLANRSLGHSLGPLAVLQLSGLQLDDAEISAFQSGFSQYLIARQLCDDLHDWPEDYKNSHVSYVVCKILEMTVQPVSASKMRTVFWDGVLPLICDEILEHLATARINFELVTQLKPPNIFTQLLDDLTAVVRKSLNEKQLAQEFLRHYAAERTEYKVVK